MSFYRRPFNKGGVVALLTAAAIGGALACGPDFPWQLLDDRDETMFDPVGLSFPYAAARLVTAPGTSLRVVESEDPTKPPGYDSTSETEAVTVEREEARSDAWRTLGTDGSPDALTAKLEAARRAADGEAALLAGAGLPTAVLDYIAGAIEFRADRFDAALKHFKAIDRLPPEQRKIREVAAAYMEGRTLQRLGEMASARAAFQATRRDAEAGAPDPIGLAVASLGEEARTDLVESGLVKAPWPVPTPDIDDAKITRLIADAVRLYAEQAARGSKMAVLSLREVAERLVAKDRELRLAVVDPLVRRLVVTYIIGRQGDYPWDGEFAPEDINRVIEAVESQPASGDDLDRLAALAYLGGRYELAERLAASATRPLGLWVRAKLALRRGDRTAAARDWTAALAGAEQETAATLDSEGKLRLRGELGVLKLSQGAYGDSLRVLFPVAGTYWGDVVYIAERVLTTDELKAFVDALPPREATREGIDFLWGPDFVPADRLRLVLARRLVRDGRTAEAVAYFPPAAPSAVARTQPDQVDDGEASAEEARAYLAALEKARPGRPFDWPWQRVGRAEALFKVATLDRRRGMELMGTEGPPDVAALDGQFAYGVSQAKPDGVASTPSKLLGPDEASRFAASAPKPDVRFHYRRIAADRAAAAAELLPQRSQAFAATLCWAARYAIEGADQEKAEALYRRYVAKGAYQAWARDFGKTCPEPDFEGAQAFWPRRIGDWVTKTAGSVRRHIIPVAVVVLVAVLGLALILRRRTLRT